MALVNVSIKQMEDRTATAGFFFGDAALPKVRRKLEPGEVVQLDDADGLVRAALASGKLELTTRQPTRPLDFEDEFEARFTSPSFKPRDPDDEKNVVHYCQVIAERVNSGTPTASPAPAHDEPPPHDTAATANRRAARRQKVNDESANTA